LLYPLLVIVFLVLLIRYSKAFQLEGLSKWTMPVAFIIKLLVGLLLFWIHIQTYGLEELSHDGGTFLREGKYLNDVFFESPKHYFQLLTGIGETPELIAKYLYMTEYWSSGDLTLINDSKNVIRLHSIVLFISGKSVLIQLAIFCVFSLIALKNFFLAFKPYIKQSNCFVFWALLLVPSTIFWTSSMLKEPWVFLGMSLLTRAILYETKIYKQFLYTGLSIIFLIGFKPYVLVCILLALIAFLIYRFIFRYKLIPTILLLLIAVFLGGILLEKPRDTIVHYLSRKQFDFVNVGKGGLHVASDTCFYYFRPFQYGNLKMTGNEVRLLKPTDAYIAHFGSIQKPIPVHLVPKGEVWRRQYFTEGCRSFIETTPIMDNSKQLVRNIPEALTNSILRPFPNDPGSNLKFFSFLEVWLIFGFLAIAWIKRRKLSDSERGIIFMLAIFAFVLFLLIGWTTPVLGAIARYRFPAQLAMVLIGMILLKPIKIQSWRNIFL
jgi:hypothetical protein